MTTEAHVPAPLQLEAEGHLWSATSEPAKGGRLIRVYRDGLPYASRTTARPYAFIRLQGWNRGDGKLGVRYSTRPLPAGRKIEYGVCVGSVAIREVFAPGAAEAAHLAQLEGAVDLPEDPLGFELATAASAKVLAERRWREAIVAAAAAGMSHRAIAAAAGATHPTIAKVLREEAR